MVDPVQGGGGGAMMPQAGQARMTESKKASLREILSSYDPESFSRSDFEAMEGELRQAGIGRILEAKSMLEDAGFQVDQYDRMGPGGSRGPGGRPPRPGGLNAEALQSFKEIIADYDLTDLTSEDQEKLLSELTGSGILKSGLILDVTT